MKIKLFTFAILFTALIMVAPYAYADTVCTQLYGGGQNCVNTGIQIQKTVQNPETGAMVENMGTGDFKFGPNQIVTFNLTVTNTGNQNIDKATVKDILPQFVSFNSGAGNFDKGSKTLSFDIFNLNVGQSQSFTVTGKTEDNLPASVTCVVNQAIVTTTSGMSNQDNAGFCLGTNPTTKGGLTVFPAPKGAKVTPPTGPEALGFLALLPASVAGLFLRKKSKKTAKKSK